MYNCNALCARKYRLDVRAVKHFAFLFNVPVKNQWNDNLNLCANKSRQTDIGLCRQTYFSSIFVGCHKAGIRKRPIFDFRLEKFRNVEGDGEDEDGDQVLGDPLPHSIDIVQVLLKKYIQHFYLLNIIESVFGRLLVLTSSAFIKSFFKGLVFQRLRFVFLSQLFMASGAP